MAGRAFSDEDFSCPICYDIFTDPVVLLCSHTICRACLVHFWNEKGSQECPICRQISRNADPPCNLALKNLCEALIKERSQRDSQGPDIRCHLHNEQLKLFCLEDQQPVCVVCRDSNKHQTHSCRAADEAAVDLKEELRCKLKPLQEKLRVFEEARRKCIETERHSKFQAEMTEKQIKEDFSKLHQFLQREKTARIAALRAENQQKSHTMKQKMEEINREILGLTASIRSASEQIQADHIPFLQRYRATLKRTQCNLKDPETLSGALIDVAKHLGNLKFRVWEKMKDLVEYIPVTLDPNTAHASIYVSHDLSSVRLKSALQACPENPERFTFYQVLLSSEAFGPGTHYWDVEVGKCEEWALGVCTESAQRGEQFLESGVWRVWYCAGVYRADSPKKRYVTLRVKQRFQKIRVHLDWSGGQVLFSDPLTKRHLHTFTHRFTERVYATFANGSCSHFLRILPLRACEQCEGPDSTSPMASRPSLFEENLCCPVCRDVFRDPVLLMCSHSFCRACLEQYWTHTELQTCPLCRTSCSVENPLCNLALKNLCEAFLQERCQGASGDAVEILCGRHKKKLLRFCLDDKQPVCEECLTSESHTNCSLRLVDEAAVDLKFDLKRKLQPLKEKLEQFGNVKCTYIQTEEHIKRQTQHTETLIKKEFEKLHQFLCEEEAARRTALREEEEQKIHAVKKNIMQMNRDILSLSDKVAGLEEGLQASNISFLQKYEHTRKRAECKVTDPETLSGALIDVAKHLGNLKFRVWEKMQNIIQYTPVILNPNTAHPCLHLSDDLTAMTLCTRHTELPANPERFDDYVSVLGSEGFDSGTHCWDVEVGDSSVWSVGVISESVFQHRENLSEHGLWHVGYYKGEYGKGLSEMLTPFRLKRKLQKIRVQLDWDSGQVSFFDPDDNTHVHTFTHTFTEPVYPYLYNACPAEALRILSVQASVAKQ
ncbi:uncharacterized protein [Salminus brasiliensis]|uniref:uncharacterized protein n=1 Tax=Salminus brasiliensis TaxID=930266 RepID=UPI003B8387AD